MRYSDYLLLQAGFANKRRYDQRIIRRAVTRLLEPYAKASLDEMKIWPVPGDEEIKRVSDVIVSEKNRERLKRMRELNDKNDTDG